MLETVNVSNTNALPSLNGNNSTILSLLASSTAQSPSSSSVSTANINLTNLLTSTPSARNVIGANQAMNMAGQRVVAKRLKMQNTGRVIASQPQVATSIGNATVIAAATTNMSNVVSNMGTQPVIRLSLSPLTNQVRMLCCSHLLVTDIFLFCSQWCPRTFLPKHGIIFARSFKKLSRVLR